MNDPNFLTKEAGRDYEFTEEAFIAEGRYNGSLDILVVREPTNWTGVETEDAFLLKYQFHYENWNALFNDALNCPEWEQFQEGEDFREYEDRQFQAFQNHLVDYPYLARIVDIYRDAVYNPDEVRLLKEECNMLSGKLNDHDALKAVAKIRIACERALEHDFGLFFSAD